jgi:diacylglycerol kinase (ATP)
VNFISYPCHPRNSRLKQFPVQTLFIINPHSGRAARVLSAVRAYAATIDAEVRLTTGPHHATVLAAEALARGVPRLIAVGGDGTLNEVARSLVGTSATLGLVPCGSGNGLGRHLGIHGSIAHIIGVLRAGHSCLIDTATADGHPFFTVAGLGFEAEVADRFNRLRHRGFLRYLHTSAVALRTAAKPQAFTIEHDGARREVLALTLAVANSDQYGNRARIAPGARADDGLLDLTAVPPLSAFNALPLLLRLFHGSLDRNSTILRLRAPSFTVERAAPGLLQTDGETHAAGERVIFNVRPASLRILAPAAPGR